jgi:hypothetical protein
MGMYLLAAKILGPLAILAGLWWWHTDKVSDAFAAGKSEVMAQWQKADDIAKAVGDETTKLLKKGAIQNETVLQTRIKITQAKSAQLAASRAVADGDIQRLRIKIDELAAPSPGSPDSGATCRVDDIKLRSCERLLASGLGLAGEARHLVDGAEELSSRLNTTLDALQSWAKIVQTANDAP